jgi:hypothetical protein
VYDLRSTFSNALAAGITVYELARMGTSVSMIEAHYGESLLDRLEAFVALEWQEREAPEAANPHE